MLYKLNSDTPAEALTAGCNLSTETSNNQTPMQTNPLKEQVENYRKVMQEDFNVKEEVFFNTIPIKINHLISFVSNNGMDLAGVRIYMAKKTPDPLLDDYELIFVPCNAFRDEDGNVLYYRDKLGTQAEEISNIITVQCRRPPGCQLGALLLP
ncbi:hypothetical protein [Chryseolinea lacunae]|uniref:Uncharacterized protein n=1 Tax=Chryseolinea lacunae TaxID=2801331 RepID=A0ABS1KTF2_9BACT|nr:hypothetical protein [Chryseolinea lacunae]MBL0741982.1 hypothetical protein [Chryseolinea lacunae]